MPRSIASVPRRKLLKTIALRGCTLYSTTEPCPMCLASIHWAKIDRVVYGAAIADAAAAGFCELYVDAKFLAEMGKSPLIVESGLLRAGIRRPVFPMAQVRQSTGLLISFGVRLGIPMAPMEPMER